VAQVRDVVHNRSWGFEYKGKEALESDEASGCVWEDGEWRWVGPG